MPITLQQVRAKYPQYSDISDGQLLDSLHSKYYSDISKEEFNQKMGVQQAPKLGEIQRASQIMPLKELGKTAADIPLGAISEVGSMTGTPKWATPQPYHPGSPTAEIGRFAGAAIPATLATVASGGAAEAAGIPGVVGRAIGAAGSGYGIAGIPGALTGLFGEPAAELAPAAMKGLGKLATKLATNKYARSIIDSLPKFSSAENVLNKLGNGLSVDQNARSLASNIRKSGNDLLDQSTEKFDNVESKAGDNSIYSNAQKPLPKTSYSWLTKWKRSPIDRYTPSIRAAHDDFTVMPTHGNAHKLQSTLGHEAYKTLSNPFSNLQDRGTAESFLDAQKRVLSDMHNHLNSVDPTGNLSNEYNNARSFHRSETSPYQDNKHIREIRRGDVTNPRNITTIFKNPERDVQKVVGDLGKDAHDKIIYNDMRKTVGQNPTAAKTVKAYEGLEKKGLSPYTHSSLDHKMGTLKEKSAYDEFLKHAGKKPTAKSLITSYGKLEKKGLDDYVPSLTKQIDILKSRVAKKKFIGTALAATGLTGIAGGLGYGASKIKKFL